MLKKRNKILNLTIMAMTMAITVIIGILCKSFLTFAFMYRLTFENFGVVTIGIFYGPIHGVFAGIIIDYITATMSGQSPNYFIMAGAASVGLVAGLISKFIIKRHSLYQYIICFAFAHLIGQVIIKSIAKTVYFGMPWWGAFISLGLSVIACIVEIFLLNTILKNKSVYDAYTKTN